MSQQLELKRVKGLHRLFKAFLYSLVGLKSAYQDSIAFKQEVIVFILIIPLTFFLSDDCLHRIFLIGSWILVIVVELINTSLEMVVDRISLDLHPLSKKIKDIGSAAVFISIINAILVWGIISIGIYF